MLGADGRGDIARSRTLTRELTRIQDDSLAEKSRFESIAGRGIAGFRSDLVPHWRRVLVTGGTGCVGRIVLDRLGRARPDAQLVSIARRPPTVGRRLAGVEYLTGDVRDAERMGRVMTDLRPDIVVHLAAQRDPAFAEHHVAETVSTNVVGSCTVLDAAGRAGVETVVVASTGKSVRFFTSDVYAATKKLVEVVAATAARRYGMRVACTRFTHVVDNSLVASNVRGWIARDEPILLHSPDVLLPVQSALEAYQLLVVGALAARPSRPCVVAQRDLGWPPISLLDLTLDYLAGHGSSRAPIIFTGFPPGYEAYPYPGTYDPRTAGDFGPLMNCVEAARTGPTAVLGESVDQFESAEGDGHRVEVDLAAMAAAPGDDRSEQFIRTLLGSASAALLGQFVESSDPDLIRRVHWLGRRLDRRIADHAVIHDTLDAHLGAPLLAA